MKAKNVIGSLMFMGAIAGTLSLMADDHIIREQTRTYAGNTSSPRRSEIWVGESKVYISSGNTVTIMRYDLKKYWTILPAQKRYFEEPLGAGSQPAAKELKPERIQTVGFGYQPEYDWIIRDPRRSEIVDGKHCRLVILEGVADYARELREIWVTRDTDVDGKRYFQQVLKPGLDPKLAAVYEKSPVLRNGSVVRSRTVTEPAIAPPGILESRIVNMEAAPPPAGIYDIPAGFRKASSLEELYGGK
jgi:hypothetical protein